MTTVLVAGLLGLFGTVVGAVLTTRTARQTAAADAYRARSTVWNALYELELSTDNRELCQQARRAIDRAKSIKSPDSQEEMDQRADRVYGDLTEIITMARLNESGRPPLTSVVKPSANAS